MSTELNSKFELDLKKYGIKRINFSVLISLLGIAACIYFIVNESWAFAIFSGIIILHNALEAIFPREINLYVNYKSELEWFIYEVGFDGEELPKFIMGRDENEIKDILATWGITAYKYITKLTLKQNNSQLLGTNV